MQSRVQFVKNITCKFCSKTIWYNPATRTFFSDPHFREKHYDENQPTLIVIDRKLDRIIEQLTQIVNRLDEIKLT